MASPYSSFAFGRTSESPNATSSDITYLPQCTSSSVATYDKYDLKHADEFDLRKWRYYKDLLPSAIGGWVAAGICLILALLFLVWLLTVCACKCCCGRSRGGGKKHKHEAELAEAWDDRGPARRFQRFTERHTACSALLCTLIVLLLLATLALAAWGLYEGLHAVDDLSTNFFAVLDHARLKVVDLARAVDGFSLTASQLQTAMTALSAALAGVDLTSLQQQLGLELNLSDLKTAPLRNGIDTASRAVQRLVNTTANVANSIRKDGVNTIADVQKQQGTFDEVQNKWVPLALGLMFAILAVLAIIAAILLLIRHVRSGSTFLCLLWLWTALWFFFGPGMLHFATRFTSDTCLYPEHFAFKVVNESSTFSTVTKERVNTGLLYYFGAYGPNVTLDDIIHDVYGIDISAITSIANDSLIQNTVRDLSTTAAQVILQVPLKTSAEQQQELARAPETLNGLISDYNQLQAQMSRSNFDELYLEAKTLLCCQLGNRVRRAWIAWTVAAAMAGLLCLVLTLRVFQCSRWNSTDPSSTQYFVGRGPSLSKAASQSMTGSDQGRQHLTRSMTASDKQRGYLDPPWPHRPQPHDIELSREHPWFVCPKHDSRCGMAAIQGTASLG